jgi:hypothetical protein
MLNLQKQENENITDQLTDMEKSNEKLEVDLNRLLNLKGHVIKNIDELVKKIDSDYNPRNIRQDLTSILQFILQNSQDNSSSQKSNGNLNLYEDQNLYQEDDRDKRNLTNNSTSKTSNSSNSNRSSYVAQNYEKFKQSQEAIKKNTENKLINQGKI